MYHKIRNIIVIRHISSASARIIHAKIIIGYVTGYCFCLALLEAEGRSLVMTFVIARSEIPRLSLRAPGTAGSGSETISDRLGTGYAI